MLRNPRKKTAILVVLKSHSTAALRDLCPQGLSGRQLEPVVVTLSFGFMFWLCHVGCVPGLVT